MEDIVLIGSAALNQRLIELGKPLARTKLLDYDYIVSKEYFDACIAPGNIDKDVVKEEFFVKDNQFVRKYKDGEIFEYTIAVPGDSNWDILNTPEFFTEDELFPATATLDLLYSLKMSHRFKKNSPHFWKTVKDIKLMKSVGAELVDETWFKKREKETYTYAHPKLNTDKKNFFTDSVPYLYSHDDLHEAVKHLDKPAYQYYAIEGEEVLSSMDKFFNECDEYTRLLGVLEESYVLALERAIIPHNVDPEKAFRVALSKVCTSITSGWFRSYAWDHIEEVLSMYNPNFVEKYKIGIANGVVKPHKKD